MKGFMLFGLPVLAVGAALGGLPEDNVQGLWSYQSVTTAEQTEGALAGLFLFHDGKFVHQAMRDGEPMENQLADTHVGTYQLKGVALRFDVEIGILVTPGQSPLLSGRSNTTLPSLRSAFRGPARPHFRKRECRKANPDPH